MAYKNQASYRAWFTRNYASRKAFAISYLGGKCRGCGSVENLEFDHIDPITKSGRIDQFLMLTNDKLINELNKCQLLCHKCHKEKTSSEKTEYCKYGHKRTGNTTKDRHCKTCQELNRRRYRKRARLFQQAEKTDLKSVKSGFESQDGHHDK